MECMHMKVSYIGIAIWDFYDSFFGVKRLVVIKGFLI